MNANRRQSGFSLIETLLAVGTLAVGMVFVAGTFTAGVYFASVSTEKTVATVVADEAVAKIALFGLDLDPKSTKLKTDGFVPYEDVNRIRMASRECLYPSDSNSYYGEYAWSAICRRSSSDGRLCELSIFVSRLMGVNATYWRCDTAGVLQTDPTLPRPLRVGVTVAQTTDPTRSELTILNDTSTTAADESLFLDAGFMIVDDATGRIYRVVDRSSTTSGTARVTIVPAWLDATAQGTAAQVWVVPRPVTGGRCPLVTVYQKVIRF